MHDAVGVADWLSNYGPTEKIGIDPISTDEGKQQIFAVDGTNGTEFTSVFFGNNGI